MIKTNTKFKETELGPIPEEWELLALGNVAELIKDVYVPDTNEELVYIGLEHIDQQTLSLNSVGKSSEVKSNKFRFNEGDILFGKLRPYFRKVYRPKFSGICSTDIWVVRANKGYDQGWLYYLIASENFVDVASGGSGGTRMPRADWQHLKNTTWPVPGKDEQKAISSILSTLDDKIELNRQINANLEKIASALFKRWFVDFEFPDKNGKPYKSSGGKMVESEMGEIPEGWKVEALDEVASFLNGLALQKYPPENDNEFFPVIKIRELKGGITDSTDKASTNIEKEYVVENGDVLFSWSGSLDAAIWCGGRGALNQHLFKVSSEKFPKWFYYRWLKYFMPIFQTIAADKAVTMGHIKREHLTESKVLIPCSDILEKMNETMQPLLEDMVRGSLEIHSLTRVRDLLMPKLLLGRLRTV